MIRVLLGSALPVLGLGLAAAFVAPSLVATSGVQPMIVGAADPVVEFRPASFDRSGCASKRLLAERADLPAGTAGLRVLALAPSPAAGDEGLVLRELSPDAPIDSAVILFFVRPDGRVVAAMDADGLRGDCTGAAAGQKPVGAI